MLRFVALLALVFSALPTLADKPAPVDPAFEFDGLAAQARIDWGVPGLAVVVVKDGRVALAKGYGVRELGKAGAVDADTLFAAASTTKAMTAAAIGLLVDEGKLGWDDPVRKYVPELQLADAQLADSLTVRELLTHHTGIPGTDYLWYGGALDWKGILAKLAQVGPEGRVRGSFHYQNVMYGLAGDVIGRVSGLPWEEFLRQRLFTPLGMSRTLALGGEAVAAANRVSPHSREDGVIELWETLDVVDPVAAAGSVWISANDAAKWMLFLLDPASGKDTSGKPLLSPETVTELFRPQVVIPPGAFYPTTEKTKPHWTTYGLGWFQQDYRGRKLDFHTGSIDGLVAIVGLVRDTNFGVAVYANQDHAELRHALMFSAIDQFLDDGLSRDWNGELRALYDERRAAGEKQRAEFEAKRVPNQPPALPLAAYAGKYADPLFGAVTVELVDGRLVARLGKHLVGDAEPWHFETFRITWRRKLDGVTWATFRLGTDGAVSAVEADGTTYAKVAAEAPSTP
jgi:CubicO group peptidase (beta-lactamase class C family)